MHRRLGRTSGFRRDIFVSECRNVSLESLQCFRKIWASQKVRHKRCITIIRRNFFLFQCQIFLVEPFYVSENLGYRKFSCIGGGHQGFVEISLSHSAENFIREAFCVLESFRFGKTFMDRSVGRGVTFFRRKVFVSQCPNFSLENNSVFRKISGIE